MPEEIVPVVFKKNSSIYCVFQERDYGTLQRNLWAREC